jgi:hypothetical protein
MKRYSIHICKSEGDTLLILVCSGGIDHICFIRIVGSEGILCQTKNRYDATLEIINDVSALRIITDHACGLIEENSSG